MTNLSFRHRTGVRKEMFLPVLVLLFSTLTVWHGDKSLATAIRIIPSSSSSYTEEAEDYDDGHRFLRSFPNAAGRNATSSSRRAAAVVVTVPTSPDDHLVQNLPLLGEEDFPTAQWAGLLPASPDGDKYLFYWLFAPDFSSSSQTEDDEKNVPLLIWLNGGPGCSSMDGLFLENGPFRFETDEENQWKLKPAEASWHKAPAYTLYIDQPVGTGLSFTTSRKYPSTDEEVNKDFYYFLQAFLGLHKDKFVNETTQELNRPFFFSGESHAGHYVPSMMAYILDQNERISSSSSSNLVTIPLSGAAIGNGWFDPYHQYGTAKAAYGKGIIGRAQLAAYDLKERQCQERIKTKHYRNNVCFDLLDDIRASSQGNYNKYQISSYDVRKMEDSTKPRSFPPGHKVVESYLGGKSLGRGKMPPNVYQTVLRAVHASESRAAGQIYEECTDPPYNALSHQDGLGVVPDVVRILEHLPEEGQDEKIRLLFFNGVEDLICNHVGNEIGLEELPWKHQEDWILAKRSAWLAPSHPEAHKVAGYVKEFENLSYLKVLDSGHMVPMDVPDVALDMIRTFMFGGKGSFDSKPQNLARHDVDHDSGGGPTPE